MPSKECSVEGCARPHQSLGYCKGHATRVRHYGDPGSADFRIRKIERPEVEPDPKLQCKVDGCTRRRWAKELCPTHYRRWSRGGDPTAALRQRYLAKECAEDGCADKPVAQDRCNRHYQAWRRTQQPSEPGKHRPYTRKYILAQYGLTLEDYERMLAEQGGCCAICRSEYPGHNGSPNYSWSVDHCHKTGRVRGLLCRDCNVVLGLMKDDPDRLRVAIEYLTR